MAAFDDDLPSASMAGVHRVGQDLASLSVDELRERVEALKSEIARLEAEIGRKSAHLGAADLLFKR